MILINILNVLNRRFSRSDIPRRSACGYDAAPRALRTSLAVPRPRPLRTASRKPPEPSLTLAKTLPECLLLGFTTIDSYCILSMKILNWGGHIHQEFRIILTALRIYVTTPFPFGIPNAQATMRNFESEKTSNRNG